MKYNQKDLKDPEIKIPLHWFIYIKVNSNKFKYVRNSFVLNCFGNCEFKFGNRALLSNQSLHLKLELLIFISSTKTMNWNFLKLFPKYPQLNAYIKT